MFRPDGGAVGRARVSSLQPGCRALELAARKSIPLATLDQELAAAATIAGVELTGGRL